MVLVALEQFKDQATDRLLLSMSEECVDSGTTQRRRMQTPVKMLTSTLSKHALYVKMY